MVIEDNRISNTSGAGIWFGSSTNGIIRDNRIKDTQYTGILIVKWWVYGPSHDNIIEDNKVSDAGSPLVWDDGIRLGLGAYNNMVHDNRVTGSNASGIRAHWTTHDNTIEDNVMLGNATSTGYDAYDQSSGSGTAGTANTWEDNTFGTASPAGLE